MQVTLSPSNVGLVSRGGECTSGTKISGGPLAPLQFGPLGVAATQEGLKQPPRQSACSTGSRGGGAPEILQLVLLR